MLRTPLTDDDIVGVYAGLRRLLAPWESGGAATTTLSREHQVACPAPGLVSVAGGKYTTYRVMAKDTVDVVAAGLGGEMPGCVTAAVPLLGAAGYVAATNRAASIAIRAGVPVETVRRMLGRYGDLLEEVLEPALERAELAEPVPGAPRHVMAEILYAVTHEGALHLDDLLARRTRISVDTSHRGTRSARAVAELVAPVLGWSDDQIKAEVAAYEQRVAQELASQRALDDEHARAQRSLAPERWRLVGVQSEEESGPASVVK